MKKLASIILCAAILVAPAAALEPVSENAISISSPSAILIEKTTGTIIYEKNAHEKRSPASVTKVMTMLLIVEELERGTLSEDDMVTTSARAASMGGSQIYLEEGEQMSVRDMFKSLAVSSANDCAVALAEHIAGTEEAFVARMNERAQKLGMKDSFFSDCTGLLEGSQHLTTAYDIALMSRELIMHDRIKEYTTIWMDSVRGGEFGLNNTNKLIYYYDGATGLKTGFTRKAMYCLSATAEKDGVEYIAVVMHADTSNERFEDAKTLLSYAFANYTLAGIRPDEALPPVNVALGKAAAVQPVISGPDSVLLEKSRASGLVRSVELYESVEAPVSAGQQLGTITLSSDEGVVATVPIVAGDDVPRMSRWEVFLHLLDIMRGGK